MGASVFVQVTIDRPSAVNISDGALQKLAVKLDSIFAKQNNRVLELIVTSEQSICIVLNDGININSIKSNLPGKIANYPVGYLNRKDLPRPSSKEPLGLRRIATEVALLILVDYD